MNTFYYGGDYNPDQWDRDTILKDMELFKKAGVNIVTLPVFSWAKFQPSRDRYDFTWFDEILDVINSNNLNICLATSTAVQPAWMSREFPEILPVDFQGKKRKFGGRVKFCPNSDVYKKYSGLLVEKLVERYMGNPNVKIWHIGNEYDNWCYCENCEKKFRKWLEEKYKTIDNLNSKWYTSFWGHTFYSWEDIVVPNELSEMWQDNGRTRTTFQSISLDYARFMSESIFNCYKNEYDIIKNSNKDAVITTNLMGFFKPLDYFKWAEYMDVISWDSYPGVDDPVFLTSMRHDLMRSLKKDRQFLLMEQTPSQTNWAPYNSLKRPGDLMLQSFQAVSHGSNSVMYFQMRRSIGACEKFHSALIDHAGREDSRVFKECSELGMQLSTLDKDILNSVVKNRVGIIFDWENWWALEYSSGPTSENFYLDEIGKFYNSFYKRGIGVDFIHPNEDLNGYDLIIAPNLYLVSNENAKKIENYVGDGGLLISSFLSGIVDEFDLVHRGGYPGPLKDVLGIWVEETDSLPRGRFNSAGEFKCDMLFDIIHTTTAEVVESYGSDFYKGTPVITKNNFKNGSAYYIGSSIESLGIDSLINTIYPERSEIEPTDQVEIAYRESDKNLFVFILNHSDKEKTIKLTREYLSIPTGETISGNLKLSSKSVTILKRVLNG